MALTSHTYSYVYEVKEKLFQHLRMWNKSLGCKISFSEGYYYLLFRAKWAFLVLVVEDKVVLVDEVSLLPKNNKMNTGT